MAQSLEEVMEASESETLMAADEWFGRYDEAAYGDTDMDEPDGFDLYEED